MKITFNSFDIDLKNNKDVSVNFEWYYKSTKSNYERYRLTKLTNSHGSLVKQMNLSNFIEDEYFNIIVDVDTTTLSSSTPIGFVTYSFGFDSMNYTTFDKYQDLENNLNNTLDQLFYDFIQYELPSNFNQDSAIKYILNYNTITLAKDYGKIMIDSREDLHDTYECFKNAINSMIPNDEYKNELLNNSKELSNLKGFAESYNKKGSIYFSNTQGYSFRLSHLFNEPLSDEFEDINIYLQFFYVYDCVLDASLILKSPDGDYVLYPQETIIYILNDLRMNIGKVDLVKLIHKYKNENFFVEYLKEQRYNIYD